MLPTRPCRATAEGDWLSINGSTGEVIRGKHELQPPKLSEESGPFMEWVKANMKVQVFANADTAKDVRVARAEGATGLGLCRTEHMFFSAHERVMDMRRMIVTQLLHPQVSCMGPAGHPRGHRFGSLLRPSKPGLLWRYGNQRHA